MRPKIVRVLSISLISVLMLVTCPSAQAEEIISLAQGKLAFKAPDSWLKKDPSSRIVEYEFSIPKAEGDSVDGRMTVMGAGGTIDANVERWLGQFVSSKGLKLTRDQVQIEKKQVNGVGIHLVDISGTYLDKPGGPFSPGAPVERPGYRMLAAIVAPEGSGNYFFKFYGPEKTVAANREAFIKMVGLLEKK